jgi:putative redox protein
MVKISMVYKGDLRCHLTHGPSSQQMTTDAPVDNQGKGEAFSPTDLVAAALGSCILTVMGIAARKNGIDINGATAAVEKEMTVVPIRRIGKITVAITMPAGIKPQDRELLERIAHSCPVHQSLHPDVKMPIGFRYPD